MANSVSEITVSRYEYNVIADKWYLEVEPGTDTFQGETIDYYYLYLQRGKYGMKRFVYGCPKVDRITGEVLSADDAAKNAESFLVHSVAEYLEEEEAINDYNQDKYCD